jgi:hypothetical protein
LQAALTPPGSDALLIPRNKPEGSPATSEYSVAQDDKIVRILLEGVDRKEARRLMGALVGSIGPMARWETLTLRQVAATVRFIRPPVTCLPP